MEALIRPELCADLSAPRADAVPELTGQKLERIVSSLPCLADIDLIICPNFRFSHIYVHFAFQNVAQSFKSFTKVLKEYIQGVGYRG